MDDDSSAAAAAPLLSKDDLGLPWHITQNPMRDDGVFITRDRSPGEVPEYYNQLPPAIFNTHVPKELAAFVVCAANCHHDLLSVAKRWSALDAGSWNVERYAAEKAELLTDTRAIIAKTEGR